jgi:putative transposase
MADYRGPAQNVRVPARPDESYKVNSVEGLKKSVFAWVEWRNYAVQTGDFDVARQFVSNEFTEEIERYDYYTKLYQEGGWIIDGLKVFEFHGDDPVMKDDGTYLWEFYLKWIKQINVQGNGEWDPSENKRHDDDTFYLHIRHADSGWKIVGLSPLTSAKDTSQEKE